MMVCFHLFSCQPELIAPEDPLDPSDSTIAADTCRIQKAWYFGGGGINDSADFIYESNRLMKVEGSFADAIYTYTGNKVSTIRLYEKPDLRLYKTDSMVPFFQMPVGFEPHLPYFLSRNNVVGLSVTGIDYQLEYTLDSTGRPLTVNLDGFEYMQYRYNCP